MPLALDLGHARRLSPHDDLVRALGWGKGTTTVVDATAGLGRDAAALARLGFSVVAIERSPAVAQLWRAALRRAPRTLAFLEGDARQRLAELRGWGLIPDAIYLDPMYPAGERKAAQQREMVELRALVGDDLDVDSLFEAALTGGAQRVVVKRSRKDRALGGTPSHTWEGTSTCFDLYLPRG